MNATAKSIFAKEDGVTNRPILSVSEEDFKAIICSGRYVAKCLYHKKDGFNRSTDRFYPLKHSSGYIGFANKGRFCAIYIDSKIVTEEGVSCHLKKSNNEITLTVPKLCRYIIKPDHIN